MEGESHVAQDALALFVLLLLILVGARLSAPARAATGCPGVITQDTTLADDVVDQLGGPSECIRFGVGGVTLDLNGKTVDIRPLHMSGRAIAVDDVHRAHAALWAEGGLLGDELAPARETQSWLEAQDTYLSDLEHAVKAGVLTAKQASRGRAWARHAQAEKIDQARNALERMMLTQAG